MLQKSSRIIYGSLICPPRSGHQPWKKHTWETLILERESVPPHVRFSMGGRMSQTGQPANSGKAWS